MNADHILITNPEVSRAYFPNLSEEAKDRLDMIEALRRFMTPTPAPEVYATRESCPDCGQAPGAFHAGLCPRNTAAAYLTVRVGE